jgi:Ca-activated chloride channel family protein
VKIKSCLFHTIAPERRKKQDKKRKPATKTSVTSVSRNNSHAQITPNKEEKPMKITGQVAVTVIALILGGCFTPTETPELEKQFEAVQVTDRAEQQVLEQQDDPVQAAPIKALAQQKTAGSVIRTRANARIVGGAVPMPTLLDHSAAPPGKWNRESYNALQENGFINANNDPLSTFSIDVDTASYSNIRRFINQGSLPPAGAVRIEEMINYFSYSYPQPQGKHPFSVTTELGPCPWNNGHKLVRIGLKAKDIDKKDLPPSNLVFLIDVSGSMSAPDKLPLLKKSIKMLVQQLDKNDRVSMVVYAGSDRVVLEPTSGDKRKQIFDAIDALGPGGSTHASKGILTAYKLAEQVKMPGGNNRVILASDGDFNVGVTSRGELLKLIENKRKSGIYLTVLGLGMGNYHDDTMELLADAGNGNYSYIDNLLEAKKVMVKEMSGTLFSLADDVKIQVEFNPAIVGAYRLIGYENRVLADEDFNNDTKDAGEIGVGHTVTALYEIIPSDASDVPRIDPLKYQRVTAIKKAGATDELMTVKLRYKPANRSTSQLISTVVHNRKIQLASTSDDFRFASAVAGYGMVLKDSPFRKNFDFDDILTLARGARGNDDQGYRAEFIRLVETSQLLSH